MHQMVQTIREIARHEVQQGWHPGLAVVRSASGAEEGGAYACTVELRETGIVLPDVPVATGLMGLTALPRAGDLVLVLFAGGDLHAPVVVGSLYNEQVAPPAHAPGELVASLPGEETDPSRRLDLRVQALGDGTRALRLVLDGSVRVEVEVADEGVRLRAQDASFSLTQTGGADGKAELVVGGSRVVIEQSGNVTVEAEGTLSLKATRIEINGDAAVQITGQTIDLN